MAAWCAEVRTLQPAVPRGHHPRALGDEEVVLGEVAEQHVNRRRSGRAGILRREFRPVPDCASGSLKPSFCAARRRWTLLGGSVS